QKQQQGEAAAAEAGTPMGQRQTGQAEQRWAHSPQRQAWRQGSRQWCTVRPHGLSSRMARHLSALAS
ncbi:unnamed protein product, partial [Closterium sp. NIES-64]